MSLGQVAEAKHRAAHPSKKAELLQAQKLNFEEKPSHCQAQQQHELLVPLMDFVPSAVEKQPRTHPGDLGLLGTRIPA